MSDADHFVLGPTTVISEGVRLSAWSGTARGAPILFVHGYPDTHHVWDPIVELLAGRFRCMAYDVRGAGASDAPPHRDAYRMSVLRADIAAVIDALSPDEPVHLVGHDWGSCQAWDAVIHEKSDPRLTGRIASLTTISGPCLEHIRAFSQKARHSGWGRSGLRRKREALSQLRRSWYVYAFQVPRIPDVLLRRLNSRLVRTRTDESFHFGHTLPDDSVNGLNLYRANFRHPAASSEPLTDLPVHLIVPLRDKYVTPALTRNVADFAPRLSRVELDSGHWVIRRRPGDVAALIAEFVASNSGR